MKQQDPFAMTENQVIDAICRWLPRKGYALKAPPCPDRKRGIDIIAADRNSKRTLYVEAKGNRKNKPTEKLFTTDQTSKHYAVQLAQICKAIHSHRRNGIFAITNPDLPRIRHCIDSSRTALKRLKIKLIWVSPRGVKLVKP